MVYELNCSYHPWFLMDNGLFKEAETSGPNVSSEGYLQKLSYNNINIKWQCFLNNKILLAWPTRQSDFLRKTYWVWNPIH